ncbi:MAG: glycerate kinase [Clostridia bacterium]|nr:glycerate kinase [Clostridia bacterium]
MKVVFAIDSFKGSLSSADAGRAAAAGFSKVFPNADTVVLPVADGGEGTTDALTAGLGGTLCKVNVTGPVGETVTATYGILADGVTCIMEMASAAGLPLVPVEKRDPMHTTTYGVGEMIRDAVLHGCRKFIIGIGGSATNDCGIGMLSALGFVFKDAAGNVLSKGAADLGRIASISQDNILPEIGECSFNIACDVTNPLCGEFGCSKIFAPQKGAGPEDVATMDGYFDSFADLVREYYPDSDKDFPGCGAAGGLGFAFRTFLGGKLLPGVEIILDAVDLDRHLSDADFVFTGEGRLDSQTVMGKVPAGVAAAAKKHGVPVIAVAGCIGDGAGICNEHGISAFFPILRTVTTAEDAMKPENAASNMTSTVEQIARLIKTFGKI